MKDSAFPTMRDNGNEPQNGMTKLEYASLKIFCAVLANPLAQKGSDLQSNMDACIAAGKVFLTKCETPPS